MLISSKRLNSLGASVFGEMDNPGYSALIPEVKPSTI